MKYTAAHYVRPLLHGFSQQQLARCLFCTVYVFFTVTCMQTIVCVHSGVSITSDDITLTYIKNLKIIYFMGTVFWPYMGGKCPHMGQCEQMAPKGR